MGTFHEDHDELHGLTVAIYSNTSRTFVGRWDKKSDGFVLIRDAGLHDADEADETRDTWLKNQKTYGVKVEYPYLTIPEGEVERVVQLREVEVE